MENKSVTTVITDAGLKLLRASLNHRLVYTKAVCGSGFVDAAELPAQTSVSDYVMDLSIMEVIENRPNATLRLQLDNRKAPKEFQLYQIGVYAKLMDNETEKMGDTLLQILQYEKPDIVRAVPHVSEFIVNTLMGRAESVEGVIDMAAYVSLQQFAQRTINQKPLSEDVVLTGEDIKVGSEAGAEDIKTTLSNKASLNHASRHGQGGSDPITPQSIGAAPTQHIHGTGDVNGLDAALKGKVDADIHSRYTFTNMGLNRVNIDTEWDYNYVAGISAGGHGTIPANVNGWITVVNYCCDHFIRQTATTCDAAGKNKTRVFERNRWVGSEGNWAEWVELADASNVDTKLNKAGDTMTGLLAFKNVGNSGNRAELIEWTDGLHLREYQSEGNYADIIVKLYDLIFSGCNNGTVFAHTVLHTGNIGDLLSNYLPLTGGTLTGELWFVASNSGAARITGWDNSDGSKTVALEASKNNGSKGRLLFNSNLNDTELTFQKYQDSTFKDYKVIHTGNIGDSLKNYLPLTGGTMSGGIAMKNLMLTDYGMPFECSAYIDFHYPGINSDFTGRLHVRSDGHLMYYDGVTAATGGEIITTGNAATLLKSQMPGFHLLQDITVTQEGLTQIAIQIPSSYWSDWKTIRFLMNLNNAVTVRLEDPKNIILNLRMESWRIDFQPHYDPSFWVVTDYQGTLDNGTFVSPRDKFQDIHTIYLTFLKLNSDYTTMQLGTRIRIYGEK